MGCQDLSSQVLFPWPEPMSHLYLRPSVTVGLFYTILTGKIPVLGIGRIGGMTTGKGEDAGNRQKGKKE